MTRKLDDFLDDLIARPVDEPSGEVTHDKNGKTIQRGGFLVVGAPMTSEELEATFGGPQELTTIVFELEDGSFTVIDGSETLHFDYETPPQYDEKGNIKR